MAVVAVAEDGKTLFQIDTMNDVIEKKPLIIDKGFFPGTDCRIHGKMDQFK